VGALLALVLALALAIYLYDHSRRQTIADGVTIDGIPVGGLEASAAQRKVQAELARRLQEPVVVSAGSRHWTFHPAEAHISVDAHTMVDEAVAVSRQGSIFTRTIRGVFGESVHRDIPLVARYSSDPVRALVGGVAGALDRPARDATVQPTTTELRKVPAVDGIAVDRGLLARRIDRALLAPSPSRAVPVPTHRTRPRFTTATLAARYPAYIVIDRSTFRLRFFDHLRLTRDYEIAVGMEGLETPAGLHHIEWEQVNPPWYVPKKAWAGALAGTVVPPGPADPLKARFMSFEGGAGIHGIDPSEYSTIGHDASHGCVRMRIPDVIDLYSKSPVGTPVYIF
jgi:lipoprotein-anchoring transpeptidase ErfK/SrfK